MIRLEGVTKVYPARPPVVAVDDVHVTVGQGELVVVHGRSGSGKTTLLNLMGLLERPDQGTVLVDGDDPWKMSARARDRLRADLVGFVFQAFHLAARRTAYENVLAGLRYQRRIPRRRWRDRALTVLDQVGLSHRVDAIAATLSGGEQQRVAIARAIAPEVELLLCDEPTGNLDSETGTEIIELLAEIHRGGATVVIVTHDAELISVAERTFEMRDGRLCQPAHPR